MALHAAKHYTNYIKEAKAAEEDDELLKAAELYELAIKQKPLEEEPYNRLMIIYRKLKNYRDELKVIEKGLNVYVDHFKEKAGKIFGNNKKMEQTGKALLKSLTPKGSKPEIFYPEPVPKWHKRKLTVEKKLNGKSK
jgi:tetratricopeptide (TPR) repeat protein